MSHVVVVSTGTQKMQNRIGRTGSSPVREQHEGELVVGTGGLPPAVADKRGLRATLMPAYRDQLNAARFHEGLQERRERCPLPQKDELVNLPGKTRQRPKHLIRAEGVGLSFQVTVGLLRAAIF